MPMTYREQIVLAHKLGAFYENGRWYFPTVAAKQQFERQVAGLEWTDKQHSQADAALVQKRQELGGK